MNKDGDILNSWEEFIKYKNLIPVMDYRVKEIFDVLQEIIPIIWNHDRTGTFLKWRGKAKEEGLITSNEYYLITHEMIHGCGGM